MKNILRKNLIVSVVALALSVVLLCGAVYAWFITQIRPSGDMDLTIQSSNLKGELYLGLDFNRDGNLDYATDENGTENPYVPYTAISGLMPTQIITLKLSLKALSGTQRADLSVRFTDSIAASDTDTLSWFDLVELSAVCAGRDFPLDMDAESRIYFNASPFDVPEEGIDLVFRIRVKAIEAGSTFDWSKVYGAEFAAKFAVTAR